MQWWPYINSLLFSNTLNRLFFSILLLGFYTCRCLTCNGMPVLLKLLARFPGLLYLLIPCCKVMPSISVVLFICSVPLVLAGSRLSLWDDWSCSCIFEANFKWLGCIYLLMLTNHTWLALRLPYSTFSTDNTGIDVSNWILVCTGCILET